MLGLAIRAILIVGTMVIVPVSAGFLYSSTQEVNSSMQPTRVILDTMSDAGDISITDDVQQISSQNYYY